MSCELPADGSAGQKGVAASVDTPAQLKRQRSSSIHRTAISGTAGVAAATVLGQALTGLAFVVIARRTSPEIFGPFASTYSISIVAGGLMDFGSSQRLTRDLARSKILGETGSWLIRRSVAQVAGALALAIVLVSIRPIPNESAATALLAMQSVSLSIALAFAGAVRAVRSPQLAAWQTAVGNAALLVVALLAPLDRLFLFGAAAATSSWLISSVLAAWSLRRNGPFFSRPSRGNPWHESAGLGVYGMAASLMLLAVPIVTMIAGNQAAGNLAAVSRWIQPLILLTISYSTFMFPTFASYEADAEAVRHLRSAIPIVTLGVGASAVMIAAAPNLVSLILGPDYRGSVNILRLSAIAVIPSILSQPIASLLQARGDDRFVGKVGLASSLGALLATGLLCGHFGAAASPVSAGVAAGLLLLGLGQRVRRLSRATMNT
jgi:O-antigen/teichoic acid export membrane protein